MRLEDWLMNLGKMTREMDQLFLELVPPEKREEAIKGHYETVAKNLASRLDDINAKNVFGKDAIVWVKDHIEFQPRFVLLLKELVKRKNEENPNINLREEIMASKQMTIQWNKKTEHLENIITKIEQKEKNKP